MMEKQNNGSHIFLERGEMGERARNWHNVTAFRIVYVLLLAQLPLNLGMKFRPELTCYILYQRGNKASKVFFGQDSKRTDKANMNEQ
jgi:hypothetical protein